MNGMNIKAKIALTIGVLVSMIVLLVALSVANLQILTATEPDSPAARAAAAEAAELIIAGDISKAQMRFNKKHEGR